MRLPAPSAPSLATRMTPTSRMTRRWRIAAGGVALLLASLAGAYAWVTRAPIRRHSLADRFTASVRRVVPPTARGHVADHVIIISVDGLRPDAIATYQPETIARLAREGATSLTARTILPSLTLPSHASMLTGVPPAVHGITWNSDLTAIRGRSLPVPTVFTLARDAGLRTAAFFSKSKFHHLEVLASLDYSQSPSGGWGKVLADRTGDDVERFLERERPNLLFVHLGDADYAGHAAGWMTPAYAAGLRGADDAVQDIVEAADRAFGREGYVLLLTSDHGGAGRDHGSDAPHDVTIPWIAWGRAVHRGTTLPEGIRTMDTAASALWLLGVEVPSHMTGRPVTAAFGGP